VRDEVGHGLRLAGGTRGAATTARPSSSPVPVSSQPRSSFRPGRVPRPSASVGARVRLRRAVATPGRPPRAPGRSGPPADGPPHTSSTSAPREAPSASPSRSVLTSLPLV
jgi:hypothetical protein